MSKPKPSILDKTIETLIPNVADWPTTISEEGKATKDIIAKCEDIDKLMPYIECDAEMSIDEAANYIGVSQQTLRNWEVQGKLIPQRTEGGHRRYMEYQLIPFRKKQISPIEIHLPGIKVTKLRELWDRLLGNFADDEKVNLTIQMDELLDVVRISIDSVEGLTSVTKTFKKED